MIAQQIIDLIRKYENQKSYDNPPDDYGAGFYNGADSERRSIIDELKAIVGID